MLESKVQSDLIKELKHLFKGCIVLKNDANYLQGFPDLIVLHRTRWAVLEVKKSENEPYQPNQEYYIEMADRIGYASMICPENKKQIFDELWTHFEGS